MNENVSNILRSLALALMAAAVYLGVKYFTGGMTSNVWWMVLLAAIIVGGAGLLTRRPATKPPSESELMP